MEFFISNLQLVTPNSKEHWSKTMKRNKPFGFYIRYHNEMIPFPKPPCTVTIKRQCARFFDEDNYIYACKGLRDAIADVLIPGRQPGRADGDKRITWIYKQ